MVSARALTIPKSVKKLHKNSEGFGAFGHSLRKDSAGENYGESNAEDHNLTWWNFGESAIWRFDGG